jgi:hypothetical protein
MVKEPWENSPTLWSHPTGKARYCLTMAHVRWGSSVLGCPHGENSRSALVGADCVCWAGAPSGFAADSLVLEKIVGGVGFRASYVAYASVQSCVSRRRATPPGYVLR